MATEQVIQPSAGQAPFPAQGIADYDAIDFRRFWSRIYVEGVASAPAWRVQETSAGASMALEIAADLDAAFVEGDSTTDQGIYYVAPHGTVVTLDVDPADATNPRVDRVVLQVRDDAHDGSGSTDARLVILAGTPTAGATVANEAGAVAVPDTALLLANVLVGAGAAAVTNADLLDMRTFGQKDAKPGDLRLSASGTPGDGWAEAVGGTLNRQQHARLFEAIGTAYGAGDGSTTFGLPDYRGRSPIGRDAAGAYGPARALGDAGGEVNHTLSEGELPPHDHPFGGVGIFAPTGPGTFYEQVATNDTTKKHPYWDIGTPTSNLSGTQNAGSGQAHNNMHPFQTAAVYVFTGSVAVG